MRSGRRTIARSRAELGAWRALHRERTSTTALKGARAAAALTWGGLTTHIVVNPPRVAAARADPPRHFALPLDAVGDVEAGRWRQKIDTDPPTGVNDAPARNHRPMPLRAGILTLIALALLAAPAHAAFEVTAFEVTPSTTVAGAHADVTIATSFPAYSMAAPPQRPERLVFHLPPGLAGDPFATPRCTEPDYRADKCDPTTQVGTVAAEATPVGPLGIPLPKQAVNGKLYNLEPTGSEPARLGAVLAPLGGLLGKLYVPTTIQARASDGGLDSIVAELPKQSGGLDLFTERMAFTLQGKPAGGTGPFMRNPTSCKEATSTVVATPGGEPATPSTRTSSFTPTDCGALPFTPHITAAAGANGLTAVKAHAPVRTVITQPTEQAGQSSVTVTLPQIISADLTQLTRGCAPADALARKCPESSRVGTVVAGTPLLAKPLTGNVFLANRGVGQLPGLTIQLADPIPLRLDGAVELTPQGIRTTFTGLPDVPLTRFELNLAGGDAGVFQLSSDLCAAKPVPSVAASFAAQSGASASETVPLAVEGCTPPPAVSAKITRLRKGRPTLRLNVTAGTDSPALREVRLLLPNALRAKPKRARKGATVRTNGRKLGRKAIRLTRDGDLRLTLPEGTKSVRAKLAKGAVRVGRKLRRAKKPRRLALRVLVRDAHGARPAVELKVRPRR
jgi:hypothetical protein